MNFTGLYKIPAPGAKPDKPELVLIVPRFPRDKWADDTSMVPFFHARQTLESMGVEQFLAVDAEALWEFIGDPVQRTTL